MIGHYKLKVLGKLEAILKATPHVFPSLPIFLFIVGSSMTTAAPNPYIHHRTVLTTSKFTSFPLNE
jgi:hypothetical protein